MSKFSNSFPFDNRVKCIMKAKMMQKLSLRLMSETFNYIINDIGDDKHK